MTLFAQPTDRPRFLDERRVDVSLASSGFCQARCESCVWPFMAPSRTVMSVAQFDRVMERFEGYAIPEFGFNLINEPFTDRTLAEKIRRLGVCGATIGMLFFSSNWLIPQRTRLEDFVRAIADCVAGANVRHVSLNATISGIDQESYDILQGGAHIEDAKSPYERLDFDLARRNVLALIELIHETLPAGAFALRIKAYGHIFTDRQMTEFWTEQLAKLRSPESWLSRHVSVHLNHAETTFARDSAKSDMRRGFCATGWLERRLAIGPNGDVGLCCEDGLRSVVVGNLLRDDLETLSASSSFQEQLRIVRGVAEASNSAPCRHCQYFKDEPTRMRVGANALAQRDATDGLNTGAG